MELEADDRLAIIELGARYNHAVDQRRAEEWAELFTEDGLLEVNGKILCQGRDAFLKYIADAKLLPVKRQHWISNAVVDAEGDGARLRLYVCCYDISDGVAGAPYMLGSYDDEVVRAANGWKFRVRRLTTVARATPS